ncbi:MAG: hypothetical protein KF703_18250 [Actinobacteria bacterium]|nr:hypothetical protein [Actinomycetota bacterium]
MVATLVVAVLAGAVTAGCGGDEPKAEPVVLRRCELHATGFVFRTSLSSCKKAIAKGIDLSVDAGFEDDPDAPGAGAAFGALCEILQGKERVVYDDEDGRALARRLHRTGVCPGKVSNLKTAAEAEKEAKEAARRAAEREAERRTEETEPNP